MLRANCQVLTAVLHSYSQRGRERFADLSWRFRDPEASFFHGLNLLACSALAAGDDCAGVAHAASGRRCLSGDEAPRRLLPIRLDTLRRGLRPISADFPDHDNLFALRIA